MKQTILIIALVAMFSSAQAQAELPNVLKLNPIALAFGNFNLSYQRGLSNASAIQFGANYWYKILGIDVSGYGVRAGYQFFITNKTKAAPDGLYIGPQFSYNNLTDKETDITANAFGVGALIGYQWLWKSGVTLDLGAGPIYQFATENSEETDFEGFLPNITIAIGYNF